MKKVECWYSKLLSPAGLANKITSAIRQFWWSTCKDRQKNPWIAWKKIASSKAIGGLGFRDIKHCFVSKAELVNPEESRVTSCQNIQGKIFQQDKFVCSKACKQSSYAWKSIFQGNELLFQGLQWIIENGKNFRAWKDNWLFDIKPRPIRCINGGVSPDFKVADLLIPGTATWDITKLNGLVNAKDIHKIQLLKPSISGVEDQIIWKGTKDRIYSVKSSYHFIHSPDNMI